MVLRLRVEGVEPASGGTDGAFFIRHQEIEYAAVREMKRQLRSPLMEHCDIQVIQWRDGALHFEVRWDGLGLNVREVAGRWTSGNV